MKSDLLFVVEGLASLLDETVSPSSPVNMESRKGRIVSITKLFAAYLRRAEESALGGLLIEITILHAAMRQNAMQRQPRTRWT
jgi:ParB family chromosome partitioning protein